jgi:hypothetical protein
VDCSRKQANFLEVNERSKIAVKCVMSHYALRRRVLLSEAGSRTLFFGVTLRAVEAGGVRWSVFEEVLGRRMSSECRCQLLAPNRPLWEGIVRRVNYQIRQAGVGVPWQEQRRAVNVGACFRHQETSPASRRAGATNSRGKLTFEAGKRRVIWGGDGKISAGKEG